MLDTVTGSEDGFTMREYLAEQEYEVGAALAQTFLAGGQAVEVDAPAPARGKRAK